MRRVRLDLQLVLDPSDPADREGLTAEVAKLLAQLHPRQRQALELVCLEVVRVSVLDLESLAVAVRKTTALNGDR